MSMAMTLLTGGGLLALGGLAVVLIEGRRDKGRRAHKKELAREAREQDRLEQAYLELGIYLADRRTGPGPSARSWGRCPHRTRCHQPTGGGSKPW
jgi:hypothetical protein